MSVMVWKYTNKKLLVLNIRCFKGSGISRGSGYFLGAVNR